MRFRPGPLRQAAVLAAVFVVARVVYRAVFAGADGTEIRLLELPLVTLPAPFSGVELLGPVTSGGLKDAALSAAPFAAVILSFGALNSLFDMRRGFAVAARRGPLQSISRALVIAWQTMPALAASLQRAARAARLRGERPGPSVLVPVLEDSIERAIALAASLELRGFAASRRLPGACETPARMTDAVLERAGWSVSVAGLTLSPGTLTVLSGPTGSGKSSVLDALSGLFQHVDAGVQRGSIEVGGLDRAAVPPRETAGFVGAVAQRVRSSFAGETVAQELGYALALRGVAPVIVAERARDVADRLGIRHLLERPIEALSAGEAELVALGAAVAERPVLLVVDEPLAELDAVARPRVVAALDALAHEAGVCVVVAEHRVAWFAGVADRWLSLVDGELRESGRGPRELEAALAALRSGHQRCPGGTNGAVHQRCPGGTNGAATAPMVPSSKSGARGASLRAMTVRIGGRTVVDAVSLDLAAGELVALTGPNGAGKSSLLTAFALPGEPGRVFVGTDDVHGLRPRARHAAVALVPETIEDLFVTDSVGAECRRADRHGHPDATLARFSALLGRDAAPLAQQHPRDLSGGQRMCLALALQLAGDPAVLLVDEPVRGLDPSAQAEVARALARAAAAGTAVLFATHELDFAAGLAHRVIRLEDGRIVQLEGAPA